MLWRSHHPSDGMSLPLTSLLWNTGRSSSSTGKSAIIEGEGWQGERSSLVVALSPQAAWTRLEQTHHTGGEQDEPGKSAAIRWHVTSSDFLFVCSWGPHGRESVR